MKNIQTGVLAEMLAGYTADYLIMAREAVPEEQYYACKAKITQLQEEINSRQPSESHESVTDNNIDVIESNNVDQP